MRHYYLLFDWLPSITTAVVVMQTKLHPMLSCPWFKSRNLLQLWRTYRWQYRVVVAVWWSIPLSIWTRVVCIDASWDIVVDGDRKLSLSEPHQTQIQIMSKSRTDEIHQNPQDELGVNEAISSPRQNNYIEQTSTYTQSLERESAKHLR